MGYSFKYCVFRRFSLILDEKSLKNTLNQQKVRKLKKVFQTAFMCAQHLKDGQNTQQRETERENGHLSWIGLG